MDNKIKNKIFNLIIMGWNYLFLISAPPLLVVAEKERYFNMIYCKSMIIK